MIDDLAELKKLLRICRSQGVTEIEFGNVKLKLGDMPEQTIQNGVIQDSTDKYAGFPEGELTPEQLMYYAVGGTPEEDPYRGVEQ